MKTLDRQAAARRLVEIVRNAGPVGIEPQELMKTLVEEGHDEMTARDAFLNLRPCSGDIVHLTHDMHVIAL